MIRRLSHFRKLFDCSNFNNFKLSYGFTLKCIKLWSPLITNSAKIIRMTFLCWWIEHKMNTGLLLKRWTLLKWFLIRFLNGFHFASHMIKRDEKLFWLGKERKTFEPYTTFSSFVSFAKLKLAGTAVRNFKLEACIAFREGQTPLLFQFWFSF